jgi:glycosyltransferase involved in cell wall biosynthesis
VGRLVIEKNLFFLLRVFLRISKVAPGARLVLVGDGPLRPKLQQFIQQNNLEKSVAITGFVPYTDIPGYYLKADLFVTASVSEVHPLTVIEAMASGLPVVAIRSTGIEDSVVHQETGLLSGENETEFGDNVINLVLDAEKRHQMGCLGVERARLFSMENCGASILHLYRQLVNEKRKTAL